MSWKSSIKVVSDLVGVNEKWIRRQRSNLLVLCYHGVVAQSRPDPWSYQNWTSAESFRLEMRWLREILEPIDLHGLSRWFKGEWKAPKGPVMITFDDGYRNNLTVAAPILREEGVPALFFLSTGYIGTPRVLWPDELRVRVVNWPAPEIRTPSGEIVAMPGERSARRGLTHRIGAGCKQLKQAQRLEYLKYLRSETPSLELMDDPEAREFMNWNEARELANLGFDIGSHTVEHPILSMLDRAQMATELRESRQTLERELGRPCRSIAYPNGSSLDVNETLFEEVKAAGYEWAFMTTPVWQEPGGDPHRISRIVTPGHTDMATYKFYASGLQARLSKLA